MNPAIFRTWLPARWLNRFALAPTDLLRDATYRRLWTSILISSFGGQVTLLALPLTAAVLLHAAPTQMGLLTAMELVPSCCSRCRPACGSIESANCLLWSASCRRASPWRPCPWPGGLMVVDALALCGRIFDQRRQCDSRQRRQIVTHPNRAARTIGRSTHAKNALATSAAGVTGREPRGVDQNSPAPLAYRGRRAAADLGVDSARRAGQEIRRPPADSGLPCAGAQLRAQPPAAQTMATCVGVWQFCNQAAMVVHILPHVSSGSRNRAWAGYVALGAGAVLAPTVTAWCAVSVPDRRWCLICRIGRRLAAIELSAAEHHGRRRLR